MRFLVVFLALFFLLQTSHSQKNARLVVHEWGTFTSLQAEDGRSIGGINTDDEPVPHFVHNIRGNLLLWTTQLPPSFFAKGYPQLHPDVTMRLETPVLYFYPPEGSSAPLQIDVRARFRGGWLTEYYPRAEVEAPGLTHTLPDGREVLGGMDAHTLGTLTWKGLRVGVQAEGPSTQAEVWLAPRRVRAASVATPQGESEKYLFYRGVGHVESLLRVHRSADGAELEIRSRAMAGARGSIRSAWLADIRADGLSAFQRIGTLDLSSSGSEVLARVPGRFSEGAFSPENLELLRADMRRALIAEGLFADEADAMLDTWEGAYFQSPGLRLFFTVPQAWTDHYLPLEFSLPVELTRVMVGRIEIATPEQRTLLAQIAAHPVEPFPIQAVQNALVARHGKDWGRSETYQAIFSGEMPLEELGVELPQCFVDYLALGRLRNALLLDELAQRPTPSLQAFVDRYLLSAYQVPEGGLPPVVTAVGEAQDGTQSLDFALQQNHPNPFNNSTAIPFALSEAREVTLSIYNLTGQKVATLVEGMREAGTHTVHWDTRDDRGREMASGVYLYRLQTSGRDIETRKLALVR